MEAAPASACSSRTLKSHGVRVAAPSRKRAATENSGKARGRPRASILLPHQRAAMPAAQTKRPPETYSNIQHVHGPEGQTIRSWLSAAMSHHRE